MQDMTEGHGNMILATILATEVIYRKLSSSRVVLYSRERLR